MLMRVRVHEPGTKINLWLPLFLIFPLALVFLLILSPLLLIAAIVLLAIGWGRMLLAVPLAITCICAMRGLEVKVESASENVLISVK